MSTTAIHLTSPALASQQTAEAMNVPARIEPELRDCHYGSWAGRTLDEVQAADPVGTALWLTNPSSAPHGGESVLAVITRISAWLDSQHQCGNVVAITHASVIKAAVVTALQAPSHAFWRIDVSPLSVTRLRRSAGRWTLVSVNHRLGRAQDA